jgi:ketosteroid isomerase-like protein
MGIESMIVKRMVRRAWDTMGQDDYDVDALMAGFSEDIVWDNTSELGAGGTLSGKKNVADWFHRWKKEFPKRKFVVKNVCLKGSCLPSPNNVTMVEWGCVETNKEGKEFQYDGVTVLEMKNMKVFRASEYISFKGLPQLSTLIKPTGKAPVEGGVESMATIAKAAKPKVAGKTTKAKAKKAKK